MRKLFFAPFIALCLVSCNWQKETEITVEHLKHQTVLSSNEILLGYPKLYAMTDSFTILYDTKTDSLFHLVNEQKQVRSFGRKGQGPDEFLHPISLFRYPQGDSLCMMDANKRTCYSLKINSNGTPHFTPLFVQRDKPHFAVLPVNEGKYVSAGVYGDARFYLMDASGNILDKVKTFPYRDEKEKLFDKHLLSQAYMGHLVSCPKSNRFAVATWNAKMISFYEVQGNRIRLIKAIYDSYPDYKYTGKHYGGLFPDAPNGFSSLTASDNYVYALYCGKLFSKLGDSAYLSTTVYVYDWDGALVKQLELDVSVSKIYFFEGELYAIVRTPEHTIVKFKL